MSEIDIRIEGRAGRITLNRPHALNAITWEMCLEIERALDDWAGDARVALVLIDAAGEKAFCAGGDIQEIYARGRAGDFAYGERFWRDEYRMNAKLFRFPKPVVTFLQGFTMGGGVGVGCHGSHRIVGDGSRIAMPECGIGLVPDVGGSLILGRAPGRLGEYLGLTADRMDAGDAIYAGFADYYLPEAAWPALKTELSETGAWEAVDRTASEGPASRLAGWQGEIDAHFAGETLGDICRTFATDTGLPEPIAHAARLMGRNSPLAMAYTVGLIRRARGGDDIAHALDLELRFTARSMEHGDFIEGIRAAVIDKDRAPKWRHGSWADVTGADLLPFTYPVSPPLEL